MWSRICKKMTKFVHKNALNKVVGLGAMWIPKSDVARNELGFNMLCWDRKHPREAMGDLSSDDGLDQSI